MLHNKGLDLLAWRVIQNMLHNKGVELGNKTCVFNYMNEETVSYLFLTCRVKGVCVISTISGWESVQHNTTYQNIVLIIFACLNCTQKKIKYEKKKQD